MDKIKKNIPNIITIGRIISSMIAPILFLMGNLSGAFLLYCYGMVSDFLDGYTARKFDACSEFGRKLDAISDKIFALGIIVPSLALGNMYMLIPLFLETVITLINGYYQFVSSFQARTILCGKYKTISLFPTMVLGLLTTKIPFLINLFIPSLVVSTKLQVQSSLEYVNEYRRLLSEKDDNDDKISCDNVISFEDVDVSFKDKIINAKDEFVYYFTKNFELEEVKDKVKILKLKR